MGIEVKVIADSIAQTGKRIITLQVKFHRFIIQEINTHRVFSRNYSSSRAIPTKKLLEQVANDPAMPVHWGKNQTGMQAHEELTGESLEEAKIVWRATAVEASKRAAELVNLGVHKQIVNRTIEPYLWTNGIITSTEWDNWFELRAHEDAQPEIHALALVMREAIGKSVPRKLMPGEWHLPYLTDGEILKYGPSLSRKISSARCCRVSYLKHTGEAPNVDEDLALFDRLAGAVPKHYSPLEHQATPDIKVDGKWSSPELHGNFVGWNQHRRFDQLGVSFIDDM